MEGLAGWGLSPPPVRRRRAPSPRARSRRRAAAHSGGRGQVRWNWCPRRAERGRSWQVGGACSWGSRHPWGTALAAASRLLHPWRLRLPRSVLHKSCAFPGAVRANRLVCRVGLRRFCAAQGVRALGRGQPGFVPSGPALCLWTLRPQVSGTVFLNTSGAPGKFQQK